MKKEIVKAQYKRITAEDLYWPLDKSMPSKGSSADVNVFTHNEPEKLLVNSLKNDGLREIPRDTIIIEQSIPQNMGLKEIDSLNKRHEEASKLINKNDVIRKDLDEIAAKGRSLRTKTGIKKITVFRDDSRNNNKTA